MTGSTPFHVPRSGAALIEEARAARQAAQRNEQEERVKTHVRAILSRLKSRRTSLSQNPPQDPRLSRVKLPVPWRLHTERRL
jgi:hypothetical protein